MAERRKRVRSPDGKLLDATVVQVAESTERFSEVSLEDGTILRIKPVVTETLRLDGHWDDDGNPVYNVKSANVILVVESAPELRKKRQVQ